MRARLYTLYYYTILYILLKYIYNKHMNNENKTKKLVLIALFSSVAAVLMFLDFSVPLAPSFVKFDLSELPVILGGYLLGPTSGIAIIILKLTIKLILKPSSTMFIGELSNFIASLTYMLPAVLYYRRNKNLKSAIISLILGTFISSIVVTIADYFIIFPLYANLFIPMEAIIKAGNAINKNINNLFTLMLISIFPFNIVKYGVTSILTILLYKKLKNILKL